MTGIQHESARPWSEHLPLLAVLVAIVAMAEHGTDRDAWLPDPWLALAVLAASAWTIASWLPAAWTGPARAVLVILPICALFGLELWSARSDAAVAAERMQRLQDRLLRYGYTPGAALPEDVQNVQLKVNAHGMWDVQRSVAKPAGTYRIVLLGDSVPNDTFVPFEERFHRLLERRLRADPPAFLGTKRAEVLNFAVEGYNTAQEQRLFEKVARRFAPDLVLWAYVLNDPFTQDGSYRRVGHSFFAHRVVLGAQRLLGASDCRLFKPLYERRSFDLAVRAPMERMRLVTDVPVHVMVLPIVAPFTDAQCLAMYEQVARTARESGLSAASMAPELAGVDHRRWRKAGEEDDITHPNAAGHAAIAAWIDRSLRAANAGTAK